MWPVSRCDNVVAVQRADGNELHVLEDIETGQKILDFVPDFEEPFFAPLDEVHFVHRDDEVRNAEQGGEVGVATALLDDAVARVHQHDGEVGRGGAGDHVARVLHVAGCVRDDELAARRGEIAIGDVDGDALLALGAQAVGEVGEVDRAAAGDVSGAFERFELVLHQVFRVIEQTADKGGLAVVHRAASVEAENFDGMVRVSWHGRRSSTTDAHG